MVSTRTLIEINHDHLHQLLDRPELLAEIIDELGTCRHNAALNEANERGRALDIGHGIQIIMQRHHSTGVTVTTEFQTVKL